MLTNLLRPWVLPRLLCAIAAVALCSHALWQAWAVVRRFRDDDDGGEAQLALERRAELVATSMRVALGICLLSAAMSVAAADALSGTVRGAMCAWGVFDAGGGFGALATTLALAVVASAWLCLHRFDMALARPHLTRAKFAALFGVVPLVWLDAALTTRFFYQLDLGAAASCCSAGLDGVQARVLHGSLPLSRLGIAIAAAVALVAAAGLATASRRSPGSALPWLSAVGGLLAVGISLPAILWYVAPHAYQTPHHTCPFCLLHADVGGVGWALGGALFLAVSNSAGLLVVRGFAAQAGDARQADTLVRQLSGRAGAALLATLVIAAAPVLRYLWLSEGVRLL